MFVMALAFYARLRARICWWTSCIPIQTINILLKKEVKRTYIYVAEEGMVLATGPFHSSFEERDEPKALKSSAIGIGDAVDYETLADVLCKWE